MTETDVTVPLGGGAVLSYPQTKLRICATYHAGTDGEAVPAGQPETVEIELNDAVPDEPFELRAFICQLVSSLFRAELGGNRYEVTVTDCAGAGMPVDEIRKAAAVQAAGAVLR